MIRHTHSSGRFDRSPASVARAVKSYAILSNLITVTEFQDRNRSEALRMNGWTVAKFYGPGDGDPGVIVKDSDWDVMFKWSKRLTKHEQRRGPGGPPPPHSLTVLLKHKRTGKKLLVSVAHLPSNVEGKFFSKLYYRTFVWRDAHSSWREHVNNLSDIHGARVMMVADWNINFRRTIFRTAIKRMHPGFKLTWRHPYPRTGTHYKRLIDATVTNLKIKHSAKLMKEDDSSDHKPYFEWLTW